MTDETGMRNSPPILEHRTCHHMCIMQILLGKQNAFAKAAARGELPRSSPRHKAAAYDLDILQKLAVAESTLVSWIEDVSSSIPDGWKEAGMCRLLVCAAAFTCLTKLQVLQTSAAFGHN